MKETKVEITGLGWTLLVQFRNGEVQVSYNETSPTHIRHQFDASMHPALLLIVVATRLASGGNMETIPSTIVHEWLVTEQPELIGSQLVDYVLPLDRSK